MNYEMIQRHIAKARIERSVALGEIIAKLVVKALQIAKRAADGLLLAIERSSDYLPRSQA